jgi:flagellar assembly factor FliW
MIAIRTTRFGHLERLEVPEDALLEFPAGLPGFERERRFALIEDERFAPFGWLQSLADPTVRFLVAPIELVDPGYPVEQARLAWDGPAEGEPELLCILTVRDDLREATANLRAPLVVDRRARRGAQVILHDDRLPLRHPILPTAARPAAIPA